MFGSVILDVLIGMIALFLAVSLVASAVTEAIASLLALRARTLLQGVKQLLNDPDMEHLARSLYNHALVNPLFSGTAPAGARPAILPSYIDSRHFAVALIDTVQQGSAGAASLNEAIGRIADPQIKATLAALYRGAGYQLDRFRDEVATWFDRAMDRLSGVYKRRIRWITLAVALAVAGALNADPVHVGVLVWQRPVIADQLGHIAPVAGTAAQLQTQATAVVGQLDSAGPLIGWTGFAGDPRDRTWSGIALMILGWAIAAGAALFGAPFWFDILQRIVALRGTGRSAAAPPARPAKAPFDNY